MEGGCVALIGGSAGLPRVRTAHVRPFWSDLSPCRHAVSYLVSRRVRDHEPEVRCRCLRLQSLPGLDSYQTAWTLAPEAPPRHSGAYVGGVEQGVSGRDTESKVIAAIAIVDGKLLGLARLYTVEGSRRISSRTTWTNLPSGSTDAALEFVASCSTGASGRPRKYRTPPRPISTKGASRSPPQGSRA